MIKLLKISSRSNNIQDDDTKASKELFKTWSGLH